MVDMLRFAFRLGEVEVPIVATLIGAARLDVAIVREGVPAEPLLSVTDALEEDELREAAPESRIRHLLAKCIADGSLMAALMLAGSSLT